MKTDTDLKQDVVSELGFDTSINVENIKVSVKDGIVTLNGFARNFPEKLAVVRAAKRLAGVKGIADEVRVELPKSARRSDTDLAATVVAAIKWITTIPEDAVTVTVRNGWLTLEGTVSWWHQKNAAEEAVQNLAGVKGVSNLIAIRPTTTADIKTAIERAFHRHALLDAQDILVEMDGSKVVLRGRVRNLLEREEAERASWSAAGVTNVENTLVLANLKDADENKVATQR